MTGYILPAAILWLGLTRAALAASPAQRAIGEDAQACAGTAYQKAFVTLHTITFANLHPETPTIGKDKYTNDMLQRALAELNSACLNEKKKAPKNRK